jgi:hypothetical protein
MKDTVAPVIRLFLLVEAASFIIASLVHSGRLIPGYAHPQARIAEGVIAAALLAALVGSWIRPASLRRAALAGQGFAFLGTLVGAFTIIVGVGPRTAPDVAYHIGILLVLLGGLIVAARARGSLSR